MILPSFGNDCAIIKTITLYTGNFSAITYRDRFGKAFVSDGAGVFTTKIHILFFFFYFVHRIVYNAHNDIARRSLRAGYNNFQVCHIRSVRTTPPTMFIEQFVEKIAFATDHRFRRFRRDVAAGLEHEIAGGMAARRSRNRTLWQGQ